MGVNRNVDFLSNCTSQLGSNSSGDPFYECMDSFPGNLFTGFYILLNVVIFVPLNIWILWLVKSNKGVATSDFVMLNQTISEIICAFALTVFLAGTLLNKKVVILIANYLSSTFLVGRPLFQTFFCVERYLAVVHPLVYLKYVKVSRIRMSLVGLGWVIILMFGWFIVDSHPKLPIWVFIGVYLVMLVVCSSCSAMILWVLKRPKPGDREKAGAYQLKRKAFIAVTVILITLVFSYGTVSCVFVLRNQFPYRTYCVVLGISWWTFLPCSVNQPYLFLSKINRLPCLKND